MIDERLLKCAEFVQGEVVCDVGTDHGKLPVYLVRKGRVKSVIACDIRPKPLEAAKQNITKAGLSDKIETILSDGLEHIPDESLTDIVIAGMGGETIVHILETCPFGLENINLIFQPMTKAELLRKWLFENGFEIQREACVRDKHYLYAVMQVKFTGQCEKPDAGMIYFGKMDLKEENGIAYAKQQFGRLSKIRQKRYMNGEHQYSELNPVIEELKNRLEENGIC